MNTASAGVYEVRVFPQPECGDPRAVGVANRVDMAYGHQLPDLTVADVYHIELPADCPDPKAAIGVLAANLLTDPVTQYCSIGRRADWDDPNVVEVGRLPGVQDPDARAIQHAASYLGVPTLAVSTATRYSFGRDTTAAARQSALAVVVNPTVDEVHTASKDTLLVTGQAGPAERLSISQMDLHNLRALSKERSLHMNDRDLSTLQDFALRRVEAGGLDISDAELEFIAGRRSDHCAHLTFGAKVVDAARRTQKAPLFKRIKDTANELIRQTPNVLSAFDDNAGVLRFFKGHALAIKKETHNSPSAVEPYGGAGTGTGGVIRDILGAGKAFKIILLDAMFAHARPNFNKGGIPAGVRPPDYLRQGVIAGSRDYGNQMGVPTGEVHIITDNTFIAKPTVMVGAIGLAPEVYAYRGEPDVDDLVITIGGRTGRDGLHGATFASGSMTAETATKNASSVQIGDPIMEKMVTDALLELRDAGLIKAITDCGAAGYGSAVGEMGAKTGVTLNLDTIPTKYPGLEAWEKLMSESQERMVLAVANDPEVLARMGTILAKHGVEWARIGVFDGKHRFSALHQGRLVVDLPYDFLENGFGIDPRVANWQQPSYAERPADTSDLPGTIERVLAHPNVHYTGDVIAQYDTTVQGNTVLPLFGGLHHDMPNDAVVLTPLGDMYPDEHFAMIRSHAAHPSILNIDPYQGAINTYAEALSKYVAVGGCPVNVTIEDDKGTSIAAMNNYVWPTPDTPPKFGSLDLAVDGVNKAQEVTGVPVISGKDSVSSTYKNGGEVIDINPVLDITIVGAIPDARKTVTADIKRAGISTLVLVGAPDYSGMAGSIVNEVARGESARLPRVDLGQLPATLQGMYAAIQTGDVLACKSVGRGGLIATVVQMGLGGDAGAALAFDGHVPLDARLFNETPGCFVVEVESFGRAADLFAGLPHMVIGATTTDQTVRVVHGNGAPQVQTTISRLKSVWKGQTAAHDSA